MRALWWLVVVCDRWLRREAEPSLLIGKAQTGQGLGNLPGLALVSAQKPQGLLDDYSNNTAEYNTNSY
jgi:hypothetical protein